jgi:hypothetical protein
MKPDPSSSGIKKSKPWHLLDRSKVEELLGASAHGLDAAEVEGRLERHGPNALE